MFKIIWPSIGFVDPVCDSSHSENDEEIIEAIKEIHWKNDIEIIYAEARILEQAELERRKNADNKASIIMALVAAMVPLIMSSDALIWSDKSKDIPTLINVALYATLFLYLVMSAIWALRAVQASVFSRVDARELIKYGKSTSVQPQLIADIVSFSVKNRSQINSKIAKVVIAQSFLVRFLVVFSLTFFLTLTWKPVTEFVTNAHGFLITPSPPP